MFLNIVDPDEHKLYWINSKGDMKSAKNDGSDVKTILSTNVSRQYFAIGVVSSYIYYANNNQLFMVTKLQGSKSIVLYNETSLIGSIFAVILQGTFIAIYNQVSR